MSGVTGILGSAATREAAAADLATMVGLLDRESPDPLTSGSFDSPQIKLRLAWSTREYEPPGVAWNASRSVGVVFVGDDFDVEAKAAGLRKRGLRADSDVACLLQSYEETGIEFLAGLNGRFCGVIIDHRSNTVHVFNDRFGQGRLYLHESVEGVHFATEAKALLAVLPLAREMDQRGLAEFFSVGCVMQNRTLYRGITLLPPGSLWTLQPDGTIRKATYFDPRVWEEQDSLSPADYGRQLIEVFGRIVPKYLRGSAPSGMSLTGGLDSRMILAWVRAPSGTLPCYTFGGPYRDCADVRLARRLAQACGQPHTIIPIEQDFHDQFLDLARHTVLATDGTMDVSGTIELYANRRARRIAPIRLTGNYGSEILRSNVAFRPRKLDRSLHPPEFCALLDQAEETYRTESSCRRLSFIAFKQVPWHHHSRLAAERSQLTPRSPFLDNELVALAYRAPRGLEASPQPLLELIGRGNPDLKRVPTDRALGARSATFTGKLQREWQEFTAKAEYAYDYGMPHWLARTDRMVKSLHLERLFLGRHKFYHFRIWYRDQLARTLQEAEFSQPLPCYRDGVPARLIRQHVSGRYNWTLELHRLLTVQLIERHLTGPACHT